MLVEAAPVYGVGARLTILRAGIRAELERIDMHLESCRASDAAMRSLGMMAGDMGPRWSQVRNTKGLRRSQAPVSGWRARQDLNPRPLGS